MAIDQGTTTHTVTKKDRTWRIEFFVADDDTIQIRFHRELQAKDEMGKIVSDRAAIRTVERTQDQIKSKTYTLGANTLTGNQILGLLNKMSDDERQVDIDNPPTGIPA